MQATVRYGDRKVASSGSAQYKALSMKNRQGEETGSRFKRLDETSPQNITGYWIKKWISSDVQTRTYIQSSYSQFQDPAYVFRLAELYLAAAEAWNEYEGPSEKVYNYLDKVRERAGIPKVRDAWNTYAKIRIRSPRKQVCAKSFNKNGTSNLHLKVAAIGIFAAG